MERTNRPASLSDQMRRRAETPYEEEKPEVDMTGRFISTGCTLLDLAISGTARKGGGIPGGIVMEVFGPSSSGKSVLLTEIAGGVQRQGGKVDFKDPEGRLNNEFSKLFGLKPDEMDYSRPNTVVEAFAPILKWEPEPDDGETIHGVFIDSNAALSTDLELENPNGDKMGARRAKEFSEQLRKTARIIANKKFLIVCSNQVRVNMDAGKYGEKFTSPGGQAMQFYASLRLRVIGKKKITKTLSFAGKEVERVIGIETSLQVYKSSLDYPYREATVPIIYNYGIDDVRANLEFVKRYTKATTFSVNGDSVGRSLEEAIKNVEADKLVKKLRRETIALWTEIEAMFQTDRPRRHE